MQCLLLKTNLFFLRDSILSTVFETPAKVDIADFLKTFRANRTTSILMQIWKSPYMSMFFILRIIELFTRKVWIYLKNRLPFNVFYRLEYIFLSPDRLSGRNDVTSDKVNFRLDIKQKIFLRKIKTSKVCVALKTIWSYCTLINIKLK